MVRVKEATLKLIIISGRVGGTHRRVREPSFPFFVRLYSKSAHLCDEPHCMVLFVNVLVGSRLCRQELGKYVIRAYLRKVNPLVDSIQTHTVRQEHDRNRWRERPPARLLPTNLPSPTRLNKACIKNQRE